MQLGALNLKSLGLRSVAVGSNAKIRKVVGQNVFFVGQGIHGGKTHGILFLNSQGHPTPPSVCLRSKFIGRYLPKNIRSFEELFNKSKEITLNNCDLNAIQDALVMAGIGAGPISIRSDSPYESVGIMGLEPEAAQAFFTRPAGLLATEFMIYDPESPESRKELARNILSVYRSAYGPNFTAYCRKKGFSPRPMSAFIQPLVVTGAPSYSSAFHPEYAGVVDTSREGIIQVCVGFGLGSFILSRRGQGFTHEFDAHSLSHLRTSGHQSYFEALDRQGLGQLAMENFHLEMIVKRFLMNPNNFLSLAGIGKDLSRVALSGQGICLEFAAAEKASLPILLQLNPVRKLSRDFPFPEITESQIAYETPNVIGQGHKKIESIVVVIPPEPGDAPIDISLHLDGINRVVGNYLLIVPGTLTSQGMGTAMQYRHFSNAAAVMEYSSNVHETGSGMDHFRRICNTGGIFYLESIFDDFQSLAARIFPGVKSLADLWARGVHIISNRNLSLWVDQEANNGRGRGVLYRA